MRVRSFFARLVKGYTSLALSGLVFALLVFAISGWYFVHKSGISKAEVRFQMRADRIATAIETSLDAYTRTLLSIEGLFEVYPRTRRSEFKSFVEALDLENASPGIFALGYIERVAPSSFASYTQSIRAEGYSDFTIKPADPRKDAYEAKYVAVNEWEKYPKPGGFDFSSDPVRFKAIEAARDSGLRAATPPLMLRGGSGERRGFVVFSPIYSTGKPPEKMEDRQAKIKGVASLALKADVFFPSALRQSQIPENMRVYVQDADVALVGGADLFLHEADIDLEKAMVTERIVDAAGRPWKISFAAPRDFGMTQLERALPWIFLIRGILLAIMLPVCLYVLLRWRQRVRARTGEQAS